MTETYKVLAQAVGENAFKYIYDVNPNGSAIISSATLINTGAASSYSLAAVPNSEVASIVGSAPDTYAYTQYGPIVQIPSAGGDGRVRSVAISGDGNVVAFGAPYGNEVGPSANLMGYVAIFKYDQNSLFPFGSVIYGEANGDGFGSSISLSYDGSVIAIGGPYNDDGATNAGHVRVYEHQFNIGQWVQRGSDLDGNGFAETLGSSVALSANGNRIAIGVPWDGTADEGRVVTYDWIGGAWLSSGDIAGVEEAGQLGLDVRLSADGNTLITGAPFRNVNGQYIGATYVYEYANGVWTQKGSTLYGSENYDWYGYSVAISNDAQIIAISASRRTEADSGIVEIYEWSNGDWTKKGLDIAGSGIGGNFGTSIDLSGDGTTIVVSEPYSSNMQAQYDGYSNVKVFSWVNSQWTQVGNNIYGNTSVPNEVSISDNGLFIAVTLPPVTAFTGSNSSGLFTKTIATYKTTYSPENKHIIINSKSIDAGAHHELVGAMCLGPGDYLFFKCANEEVIINVSGVELS